MHHTLSVEDSLSRLGANQKLGLTGHEAGRRLATFGKNTLPEPKKESWFKKILNHFKDVLMIILFLASMFSFIIGETKDGAIILFIILANAAMGLIQEAKADNAIAALKKLSVATAKVMRDGSISVIPAENLVPGDIILIESGDKIPADARLLESADLKISEASLTGESRASEKNALFVGTEDLPIGDRLNMTYKDSAVILGRGRAIITDTGLNTEIGKIFSLLQKKENKETRLSLELNKIGKQLTAFAVVAAIIIFGTMMFGNNEKIKEAILTAISMAVAIVPEGIPAVVTTVLAISVARLASNHAIIRKMEAVETLGSATAILTDKTGTLTKNEMTVSDIILKDREIKIDGTKFLTAQGPVNKGDSELDWLITASVICNDAEFGEDGRAIGDPTETALLTNAQLMGFDVKQLRQSYERIHEIPFSSETKKMTVVVKHKTSGEIFVFTKGAPEAVISLTTNTPPDAQIKVAGLSEKGVRNLAYASKKLDPETDFKKKDNLENALDYLGIIGKKDPLRPEVKEAVSTALAAGIKTIMITGDHKLIAKNIGEELGIINSSDEIMDGTELKKAGETNLPIILKKVRAFGRVSPEQKLKIVEAARSMGEVVIVTGDGVNDAPAIKAADIGVAMGKTGTDVAKETADMVLEDDNYATIVSAISQGRSIFNNFIKFLKYQISCNLSGVLIVFPITLIESTAPLLPVHILLLNLISETGPSIALGLEKPEKNIMSLPPRPKSVGLLNKKRWGMIIAEACLLSIVGVTAFYIGRQFQAGAEMTAVLATAFLSRLWHAFSSRSENFSAFSKNLPRNSGLILTIVGTLSFLLLSIYTKIGNDFLKTLPLQPDLLLGCLLLSILPFISLEIYKIFLKKS